MQFLIKKPVFEHLKNKWTGYHRETSAKTLEKHKSSLDWLSKNIPTRQLAMGGLGSLMLLTTPAISATTANQLLGTGSEIISEMDNNKLLAQDLKDKVPQDARVLTSGEETEISEILTSSFKIRVKPEIDGIRLNRTYGTIGGEQHLYRYPGDNLYQHVDSFVDWAMFGPAGIAPQLGAWGYFAPSQEEFNQKDKERERYYLAIQTFLAPGFAENVGKYRDFFKFRKMLVVNPKSGQAVVAVIGDVGPASWTGKHLGGSPEVMHFLGLGSGPRQGSVLYFFIDDPGDLVPLGPIKVVRGES